LPDTETLLQVKDGFAKLVLRFSTLFADVGNSFLPENLNANNLDRLNYAPLCRVFGAHGIISGLMG
jgi:hypothetical protein